MSSDPLIPQRLGKTDILVSPLGLGTVKFGRNTGVKYPETFELPSDRTIRQLLNQARELGINLLDTAPSYGSAEMRLGEALANDREHWVLCTKVGETYSQGRSSFDFRPEQVKRSIERSLTHLRTSYVDIALLHSDGNDLEILRSSGALEALVDLKKRGLVRAVGISHKTVAGAQRALESGVDVIMATLNLEATQEREVIQQAAAAGVGVLIKKALGSGHLQAESLAFSAAHAGVSSVIVGTLNARHLVSNVETVRAAKRSF